MAKYPISQEGISQLRKLALSLRQERDGLNRALRHLWSIVTANEEELGEYAGTIFGMLREVSQIYKDGSQLVDNLADVLIPRQIEKIEDLLSMFGDGTEEIPAEPPQKIKRKMRMQGGI